MWTRQTEINDDNVLMVTDYKAYERKATWNKNQQEKRN